MSDEKLIINPFADKKTVVQPKQLQADVGGGPLRYIDTPGIPVRVDIPAQFTYDQKIEALNLQIAAERAGTGAIIREILHMRKVVAALVEACPTFIETEAPWGPWPDPSEADTVPLETGSPEEGPTNGN